MNRIDTLSLMIPNGAYTLIDSNMVEPIIKGDTLCKYQLKNNDIIGINALNIYSDKTELQLSSKILGLNYLQGINLNTIEQTHSKIIKTGLIDIPIGSLLDGIIRRSDLCSVMKCDNIEMVLDSFDLNTYDKHKINYTRFNRKNNQGIMIQGKLATRKQYIKFYDKLLDLKKASNKQFCQKVGHNWIESNTKNLLRIESEYSRGGQKELSKIIGIHSNKVTLNDILSTDKKILHTSLNQLLPDIADISYMDNAIEKYFSLNSHMTFHQKATLVAYYHYLLVSKGDWDVFKAKIKKENPHNYRSKDVKYKMEVVRKLYEKEHQNIAESVNKNQYLNQIKQHLLND